MPYQIAIHERCADFMAGPGGMAELAKTDPEYAQYISDKHDWMVRNGWTVESWFGAEGEAWGRASDTSRAQRKSRRSGATSCAA
jgi:hypothetical protein